MKKGEEESLRRAAEMYEVLRSHKSLNISDVVEDEEEARNLVRRSEEPHKKNPKKMSERDFERLTENGKRWLGRTQFTGRLAIAGIAAGAVLDTSNRLHEETRTQRMIIEQEKQLQRQQGQEERALRKMFGYEYVDFGNIVHELWDERIGHHKMGNSKFI